MDFGCLHAADISLPHPLPRFQEPQDAFLEIGSQVVGGVAESIVQVEGEIGSVP